MKSLNSNNKKIKWFHEVTGFPFSKCRQKLREKQGDFNKVCEEYFLGKMRGYREKLSDAEILMGSVQFVKMSGKSMPPQLKALEDIAAVVISELNGICVAGNWIKCTDIYLCSGCVSMDIIYSNHRRVTVDTFIGSHFVNLIEPEEQRYVIICLIDEILWVDEDEVEDGFFEYDDEWLAKWLSAELLPRLTT